MSAEVKSSIPRTLPANKKAAIAAAKVLVVGAGGIGSEIIKNLVLTGFNDLTIIDLDTIDVSNLNRQFLFRKEHVGLPKAVVARQSALEFNPNVRIVAFHDSIMKQDYNVNFFKTFTVVLNALDNRQARNHVNRMCLAADVPLIDSGTAGYMGQVDLIKKNLTSCYECVAKKDQKTYPSCTIRNTPSEPVHCIVWAKHLFNQLFGEPDDDEEVSPNAEDPEAMAESGKNALEGKSMANGNVNRKSTQKWAQECNFDCKKLFTKLFNDDIKYLLSMANLWEKRRPPVPVNFDDVNQILEETAGKENVESRDMHVWSIFKCANVFSETVNTLKKRVAEKEGEFLTWDKDDKVAMDFVAGCANIRAHIFGIKQLSRFEIKSIAGNIIPAIATSNAIIAGVVVMRALNVLVQDFHKCQTTYLRTKPNYRNKILVTEKEHSTANPNCYVCSAKKEVTVLVDIKSMKLIDFQNEILIKSLNMTAPDAILMDKNVVILSSEEGETDCNNDKTLFEIGVIDGSILKVDDFLQNYELHVTIAHRSHTIDEPLFELILDPNILKEATNANNSNHPVELNNHPEIAANSSKNGDSSCGGEDTPCKKMCFDRLNVSAVDIEDCENENENENDIEIL